MVKQKEGIPTSGDPWSLHAQTGEISLQGFLLFNSNTADNVVKALQGSGKEVSAPKKVVPEA